MSTEGAEEEGEHEEKQGTDTEEDSSTTSVSSKEENVASTLPIGKLTVFGYSRDFHEKYKEGKVLGRGQFGCTHSAIVLSSNEVVAVKKINRMKMIHPISVEDVKREVKILAALSGHKNVVQFYEAFEDDDFVYIVMELCEGGELLDRMLSKKNTRYTEQDAATVVRQMLNVAARCHLHGIVHRDLKPENFLFKSRAEDSPLKATDFGLSNFIVPDKKFSDIVGSAYYIAPEVLRRNSGSESDVWSIGVITFILLSGKRPFWNTTQDGIFREVLRKPLDFSSHPWPMISESAKDFVKNLLAKEPKARLTAAQALSHPWVRENGDAADIPLDISVLSNMRNFVKYSRLKQIALKALGSTLGDKEIMHLQDQFNAIDIDKNGAITFEEIREALNKDQAWKLKELKVFEILQAMDTNSDGVVDFNEFVAATFHAYQLEEDIVKWNKRISTAFDLFDTDKDGFITPEELKVHTGLKGSIGNLLDDADIDKDGRISLNEFRKLLQQGT